jgi:hypothetical protein
MLPSFGIRRRAGGGERERVSSEVPALAPGAFHRAARNWILAAAPREAVRGETELFERGSALDSRRARCWNDRFPAGNRGIHCRSFFKGREVKKKTFALGIAVITLLLVAVYLRMDSSTPPGQVPLATLTAANFATFEESFDKSLEGPRLLLLLSPT